MRLVVEYRDSKRLIEVEDDGGEEKSVRDAIACSFPEIPDVNACLIQVRIFEAGDLVVSCYWHVFSI